MFQISFDENKLAEVVRQAVKDQMSEMPLLTEKPQEERKILYSINALAEFLNCSQPTAQKLKNSGRIPYRQIGRKVMFDSAEVLKAMDPSIRRKKR